jgi:uncharacterized protein with HEPN domain
MKDDRVYIEHIKEAIQRCFEYTRDLDYASFCMNNMAVDAVIRQLEILGEATARLSPVFRQNHPELPYRLMIDMRNTLIHNYSGVNVKIVWDTCKDDLPGLYEMICRI